MIKKCPILLSAKNNYLNKIDNGALITEDKKKYKKFLKKYDEYKKLYNQKNHQEY